VSTLPVVLYQAPHEKKAVERLVRFCKELDGTEVQVFTAPEPEGMRYPEVANWSFRYVAERMKGQAFIWIEADVSPLKAGWAAALSKEYERVGKEYLYAGHMNPPFDNFSGVGVQGPNAFDHAPIGFKSGGFDEFIVCAHPDKIGRTELIRHSYGTYDANGDVTLHEFPRDMGVIGDKAVLFHKDQKQGLLDVILPGRGYENIALNASTTGDAGDIFVMLATLKHTGKQCDVYLRDHSDTAGIVHRAHLVKPLIELQPYINSVRIWKRETLHWESEKFRRYGYINNGLNLAQNHAQAAIRDGFISSMPDVSEPWLSVDPDTSYAGRVVINRSPRYNNPQFPWGEVVRHFGSKLVFIGLAEEHARFCEAFGQVEYQSTKDFLQAARMIAGSDLFIGNQSACMTIAEGLKHPRIQEVCLTHPDCIYPGNTWAQYVADGVVNLPDGTVLEGKRLRTEKKTHITPPKGWQYAGYPACPVYELLVKEVAKRENLSTDEASERVYEFNANRCPDFFADHGERARLLKFQQALENSKS
jgi:hypothetical protein